MRFKAGELVICIDDKFTEEQIALIPNRPIEDKVYTIREAFPVRGGKDAVRLEEIINPQIPEGTFTFEPSFNATRFRSVSSPQNLLESVKQLDSSLYEVVT